MLANNFLDHFSHFMTEYENLKTDQHVIDGFNTAEVHTIVTIGKNKNISLHELASKRKISTSAASQLTSKLESRGIIKKQRLESNTKKSALYLTNEGQAIFEKHQEQQKYLENNLQNIVNELSDEERNLVIKLLDDIEGSWNSLPWRKESMKGDK
ncbi:MarR family transcriptional regulator [Leuconostoc citreum]|uniref:MarR family winged helix-turn-helix transcriptional regulator n=1 Tax=Leuconostoc citreum TaxID=33964 RepID=UPI00200AD51D|nr:MarR family transcriptional regulator [Leuconostoc citreum]MCK8605017.1 MarR family transcriptional regulator [Leuconostoc citreum]